MEPKVFDFNQPREFLSAYYAHRKALHPHFSLRAWAQQMGFKGHASLLFLLNGRREVKPIHVEKIVKGLKLNFEEESYFKNLVHLNSSDTEESRKYFKSQLDLISPAKQHSEIEIDRFRLVADWYHMAILEMTRLKDFKSEARWISEKLLFSVPVFRIEEAIQRLINLKLLKLENGQLVKTNERLTTAKDRASESIREHHRQVLKNAIEATETQTVDERFFNSFALTVDSKTLPEAKELALKFREDLTKLMEKNGGDTTYQVSLQIFKVTPGEKI